MEFWCSRDDDEGQRSGKCCSQNHYAGRRIHSIMGTSYNTLAACMHKSRQESSRAYKVFSNAGSALSEYNNRELFCSTTRAPKIGLPKPFGRGLARVIGSKTADR
ncbi:hypothetical protein HJC23_001102 [Cyclotella cryptica]|uniref:Uncharacterized protein n=1 Tax=Cyclotella cryptica TaxID=29204 RepID=A0ABD3QKY1_9STRA